MTSAPQIDREMMQLALSLALRGRGRVEPNPMVGCVIARGGKVLGTGWHRKFGGPHAEVHALRACRDSARGATVYVTLEPCCIFGKTPPCTDALIAAGIKRVVAATTDPNPRVSGRGLRALRAAGVQVETGLLAGPARELVAPFAKLMTTGLPWVILKWAQSLDGCIATRSGDAKWISDAAARKHAHEVRGRLDAIVIGKNTALRDDPLLTARVGRPARIARRIVLDERLEVPLGSQLVRTARDYPTWLACGPEASARRRRKLERQGCRVLPLSTPKRATRILELLRILGAEGCANVLFEGGGEVLGECLDARIADELHVYIAPLLIGGRDAIHPLAAAGPARVSQAVRPADLMLQPLGDGWFAHARIAHDAAKRRRKK